MEVTAEELSPGDVVESAQGPSRVDVVTPEDGGIALQLTTVTGEIGWGDWYPKSATFTLVDNE